MFHAHKIHHSLFHYTLYVVVTTVSLNLPIYYAVLYTHAYGRVKYSYAGVSPSTVRSIDCEAHNYFSAQFKCTVRQSDVGQSCPVENFGIIIYFLKTAPLHNLCRGLNFSGAV